MSEPNVCQAHVFWIQVCVPATYTDEEVIAFGERQHPAGTSGGWHIVKQEEFEQASLERAPCDKYPDNVHIVLRV